MKKYIYCLFLMLTLCTTTSCEKDELDAKSIFDTSAPKREGLDAWLFENYVVPYNIDVKYKWEDMESNMSFDLTPAGYKESMMLSKIIKYVWLEAYDEVVGIDFTRSYVPKQILLIGASAYYSDIQGEMLGTAEGGLKVILYKVNRVTEYVDDLEMLNKCYFHTMHHEFAHILHQTKDYSPDYDKITESGYIGSEWTEKTDAYALEKGFITAYAMDQPDEDFVEMIACRVTNDQAWWDRKMEEAGKEGAALIEKKLEMVKNYLYNSWNIEIDHLREVVLRRCKEVKDLDLDTL